MLPLVFTFDERGVEFLVLGRHAGLMWSFWSIAAAAWVACYAMHRRVKRVACSEGRGVSDVSSSRVGESFRR
jgi:hypothetical protein